MHSNSEKILSISEVGNFPFSYERKPYPYECKKLCKESPKKGELTTQETKFGEGFIIQTNERQIKLLIDQDIQCCEYSGYFMSEDDIQYFIGAELIKVYVTDTNLNTKKLQELEERIKTSVSNDGRETEVIFVSLETNRGTLQFVAYNNHNGYYGHMAYVSSQQLCRNLCDKSVELQSQCGISNLRSLEQASPMTIYRKWL